VFFVVSTVLALPALGMLWAMRDSVRRLEVVPGAPVDD
jgi:MFS transporter, PAT family, beta-lactamase induction signal transducer AmpG